MRQIIKLLVLAVGLLAPSLASAQCTFTFPIPANTVIGRLGTGAGPCQAIPFASLSAQLAGATITLNSGNGQTAPGAMSGGNTYSFGANTDTPRFAGVGLGGAAPATGLEVYNAAVNGTGNGQGISGASSTNGGVYSGQGSVYDAVLANKTQAVAAGVTTGTQDVVLLGKLTAASLQTSGSIAGSLCATSGGAILYEAGVNCYAVSGISVVSGKVLTVDNTIELAGTDSTKFTFPSTTGTVDTLEANQTVSGNKTFSGTVNITGTGQLNGTAFGTFATQSYATPPAIGGTTPAAGSFTTLTATTPVAIASGGTNASTAAGARASSGLNVESYTPKGDTSYTIAATDRTVGTSATLTAPRTWTLPAASAVNPGQDLIVADMFGGATNTNTITISRAGSDTVNGGTSVAISVTNGAYLLRSDGVSKWTAQQLGAQATVGVSSINGQTGNPSVVAGTGISVNTSGGNISVANTGVTSVATGTGLTGGTITTTGTIALASTSDKTILSNISGGSAAPSANNAASVGASWVLIQSQAASSSATIDFTSGITSTYDEYVVTMTGVIPATNAQNLNLEVSTDGGSTWHTTSGDYKYALNQLTDGGVNSPTGSGSSTVIAVSAGQSNNSGRPMGGNLYLFGPSATTLQAINWQLSYFDGSNLKLLTGSGLYTGGVAINGLRFLFGSGNITSGTFTLYGIRKS